MNLWCSSDWPQTCSDSPASVSRVLGLQAGATTAGYLFNKQSHGVCVMWLPAKQIQAPAGAGKDQKAPLELSGSLVLQTPGFLAPGHRATERRAQEAGLAGHRFCYQCLTGLQASDPNGSGSDGCTLCLWVWSLLSASCTPGSSRGQAHLVPSPAAFRGQLSSGPPGSPLQSSARATL